MIPTARSIDHMAFTVPDLEAAITFFVDVLGARHAFTAGPFEAPPDSDWMVTNIGVHARARVRIAMLRLGSTTNVELFGYEIPGARPGAWPANSDVGAAHVCVYVDDMDAALAYLREQPGVGVLGEPTTLAGDFGGDEPNAGITFVYLTSPWGMVFELITYPDGMAYTERTDVRLADPAAGWDAGSAG